MDLNDASRIIDVIDQRIAKKTASEAHVETTWGTVATISTDRRYLDVYLYGDTSPYASPYFRLRNGLSVNVGDSVKVAIDRERGDRWVEEVHVFSAYNKVEWDLNDGTINFSDGVSVHDAGIRRGGVDIIETPDRLHVGSGITSAVAGYGGTRALTIDSAPGSSQTQIVIDVAGAGRALIRADTFGNIVLSGSASGSTHLAWDGGTGGVYVGDGAGTTRLRLGTDSGGNIIFGAAGDTNLYRADINLLRTDDNFTVGGGVLTINKSGTTSTITFPAQTNDPGFIQHIENANAAEMRFSVSDDVGTADFFSFGSSFGGWTEAARLDTAGNLQIDGALTIGGVVRFPNDVWHLSAEGQVRFYFALNSRTYFGSDNGYEWRNTVDAEIATLDNAGNLSIDGTLTSTGATVNGTANATTLQQGGTGVSLVTHSHTPPSLWAPASAGGGAAGDQIWVGTTDPGASASEGDVWIKA